MDQSSSTALNLERIDEAIRQHDENCTGQLIEIRMCGYEVDRLGWEEYKGIPIVVDGDLGTGRFKLVCERDTIAPPVAEDMKAKPVPVEA